MRLFIRDKKNWMKIVHMIDWEHEQCVKRAKSKFTLYHLPEG